MNLKVLCSQRLEQIKISQVSQFSVAAIPVLQQYEESDLFQIETCSVSFSSFIHRLLKNVISNCLGQDCKAKAGTWFT